MLANDSDLDGDPLVVDAVTQPANGTATISADGTVTYATDPDFTGTDTFTYTVCDPARLCDTAIVTVDVAAINDPPVAEDDVATSDAGEPVVIPVLGNDIDVDGDLLGVLAVTQPANGTVVINGDGAVTYTPNPGFAGPDSFTYTICDPSGACDAATVVVAVGALADLSGVVWIDLNRNGVVDGAETGLSGIRLVLTWAGLDGVLGTADDVVSGDVLTASPYTFVGLVPGVYRVDLDVSTLPPGVAEVSEADGSLDEFQVVSIGPGESLPGIDFGYMYLAASLADDDVVTTVGEAVVIDVLANDELFDGMTYTTTNVSDPAHGTAVLNADGTITYIPAPGFAGTDSFTYEVIDTNGMVSIATVTVVVQGEPGDELPFTGADSEGLASVGLVLPLVGVGLVSSVRRRRRTV